MHDILSDKVLYPPFNLKLVNRPSRRGGLQIEIPRVEYKVGRNHIIQRPCNLEFYY